MRVVGSETPGTGTAGIPLTGLPPQDEAVVELPNRRSLTLVWESRARLDDCKADWINFNIAAA